MKRIITIAALGLMLTGCDNARRNAEAVVRANLKDPDSAKFGDFYYNSTTKRGCIEANARNEMGGYPGPHPFEVQKRDGGWEVVAEQPEIGMDACRRLFADVGLAGAPNKVSDDLDRAAKGAEDDIKSQGDAPSAADLDNMADAAHNAADNVSANQ